MNSVGFSAWWRFGLMVVSLVVSATLGLGAQPDEFPSGGGATWRIAYSEHDIVVLSFRRSFQPNDDGGDGVAYLLVKNAPFKWTRQGERVTLLFEPDMRRALARPIRVIVRVDAAGRLSLLPEEVLAGLPPDELAAISWEQTKEGVESSVFSREIQARYGDKPVEKIGPVPAVMAEAVARIGMTGFRDPNRQRALAMVFAVPSLSSQLVSEAAEKLTPAGVKLTYSSEEILPPVLAAHPAISLAALTRLFENHPSAQVWRIASEHPLAPKDWAARYRERVKQGDQIVKYSVAMDPGAPEEFLLLVAKEDHRAVLRNPAASAEVMRAAYAREAIHPQPPYLVAIASHAHTPADVLLQIAADGLKGGPSGYALDALTDNPNMPDKERREIANLLFDQAVVSGSEDNMIRHAYACPYVDVDRLTKWVDYPVPVVRHHLASNPNLPVADLERLANDPVNLVAWAARTAWIKRDPGAAEIIRQRGWRPVKGPPGEDEWNYINNAQDFVEILLRSDLPAAQRAWARLSERWQAVVAKRLVPPSGVDVPRALVHFTSMMGPQGVGLLTSLLENAPNGPDLLQYVLANGLIDQVDVPGLYASVISSAKESMIQALLAANLPVTGVSRRVGTTPLIAAVRLNRLDLIQVFVQRGADPRVGYDATTPWSTALRSLNLAALRLLASRPEDREFLRTYDAWAQPATGDSRWLGLWSRGDGFMPVGRPRFDSLVILGDGSFRYRAEDRELNGAWHMNGDNLVGLTLVNFGEPRPAGDAKLWRFPDLTATLTADRKQIEVTLGDLKMVLSRDARTK